MMTKKLTSLVLALVMCLSLCVPAMAAEPVTESQIQAEIQAEKEQVFSDVYRQLQEQDAVCLMDTYEEILGPQIEMGILSKYGISTYDASYYAPYGGVVAYSYSGVDTGITYLDMPNAYHYILTMDSVQASPIIQTLLGYIPYVGAIFSGIFGIQGYVNATSKSKINKEQGYAMIVNTFDINAYKSASVLTGWVGHPYMSVPTGSTSAYADVFQEHNPWG